MTINPAKMMTACHHFVGKEMARERLLADISNYRMDANQIQARDRKRTIIPYCVFFIKCVEHIFIV
jgi:hypothetical protein